MPSKWQQQQNISLCSIWRTDKLSRPNARAEIMKENIIRKLLFDCRCHRNGNSNRTLVFAPFDGSTNKVDPTREQKSFKKTLFENCCSIADAIEMATAREHQSVLHLTDRQTKSTQRESRNYERKHYSKTVVRLQMPSKWQQQQNINLCSIWRTDKLSRPNARAGIMKEKLFENCCSIADAIEMATATEH